MSTIQDILNYGRTYTQSGLTLDDSEVREIQQEIERLRGFISRRYPGFDVDEAILLFDVTSKEGE